MPIIQAVNPLVMTYTVSVKGWFRWKHYSVHTHETEALQGTDRLVLALCDGSVLAIPDIGRRCVKIGSDHENERARVKAYKDAVAAQARAMAGQQAQSPLQQVQGL